MHGFSPGESSQNEGGFASRVALDLIINHH